MWRAWCAANNRESFPAKPKDLIDYILIHSPSLERDATGTVSMMEREEGGHHSASDHGKPLARIHCNAASNCRSA
jgi:hypothetical protein